jgi:lipid II:glycine glycyltransferase (peptidoglycan interpeptide bridge formation enzyme)
MEIKEIQNKEIWENFLLECDEKTFLQSWNWGEFNKMMGNKIWRFGISENNELISVALIIKIQAKRGTFLFCPHGPVLKDKNEKIKILEILLNKLKEIAKEENCSFIRIAPILIGNEENVDVFKKLGFKDAPMHVHPEITWELNLEKSEEELLMDMRKTTRYLTRQGFKIEDLKIKKSQNPKDIEIFNTLYQKTVNRHHFIPFSLNYLKNEFSAFLADGQILMFLAKYQGECLASAIIIFWQGMAFYHQGASSQKYPKIPASYLLQWEAIKEAKNRGCKIYNFWGITETDSKKHPFWGLTCFKKGFGGYEKKYVKTQDLPLSIGYWLTFAFEKLRKKKRGF